jgi:pyruvate/2-oxoglutarate dehydrogenase complex dihydrolipoamide dehydrogenase (E3) component
MSREQRADVIIIGSGQAAVPLATRLVAAGRRVVLAERGHPGGTCVNAGCTPTKALIARARVAHVARNAARFGVHAGEVSVDFAQVMAQKTSIVQRWRNGIEHRLQKAGDALRFVRGHACFVAPHVVEVNGERFAAERVVLNVGARPAVPDIAGLTGLPYLTSTSALELTALPSRLVIVGAGYIACELGQMFRRFGSEVTLVAPSASLLSREDPEVSAELAAVFRNEGIALELGQPISRATFAGGAVELKLADGRSLFGSHLLVATGRTPNTADLGCEAGNVKLDASGHIVVDDRYETSAPGVFAVGDATPGPQFTHVSWDDHRVLFDVLCGKPARARSDRRVPHTVFTDPQVAGVGLSATEAKARGFDVEVASMPFGSIARAIETDETAGIVRLVLDRESERILGARIVGVDAGELIHVFCVLMQAGATARAVVDAEFVHPTFAEGLQSAVMTLPRYALSR